MDSRTIYLLAALLGGAILPVQVAINTLLRRYVGEPMQVTLFHISLERWHPWASVSLRDILFLLQRLWLKPPGGCGLEVV